MIGTYGGYVVKVSYEGDSYELHTEDGVRGIGYPVEVSLVDGTWKVYFKGSELKVTKVFKLVRQEIPNIVSIQKNT